MFRAGSKVLNGLNLSFNVFRAGSKVFDVGKNILSLIFVRVPRFLMLVYCAFIVFRAGSKVFDAGKT